MTTPTAPVWLGRKFRMTTSDNFEEFLRAKGVGLIGRKMANSVTPTVSLTVDGDVYTFHTFSVFKNHASSFKLNEEFDEETPDGRTVRSVITLEGDRMLHRQLGDNPTTIDRTFSATEVTVTMTYNGVVCTRKYAAVE